MTKVKEIFQNKVLLSFIMAIFSYVSMIKSGFLGAYNFYSWLIFALLILVFYKYSFKEDKNCQTGVIILSLIFSFLLVLGRIISNFELDPYNSFLTEIFKLSFIVYIIGNFNLIYTLLINLSSKLINLDNNKILNKNFKNKKKIVFIASFLIFLGVYLIYLLAFYPGLISPDSISELSIPFNNFAVLKDHHPFLHVLFISAFYELGMFLFHNINAAVALILLIQMTIMSLVFAYLITFLYERKIKNYLLVIVGLFFTILPMHGFYSITMWKDVLYGCCVLLLTMETIKLLEKDKITLKNSMSFIVVSLLNVFLRNNAIYAYLILIIASFMVFKKSYKSLILIFAIVLSVYGFVKYPVFNYFNISRSSSSEYIAIPLQQVGRMAFKNVKFTKKEEDTINKLIPLEVMKISYNPKSADGIKFNKEYHTPVFDENKLTYFKLWATLVVKHPVVAVESYLTSTIGYWYPSNVMWSVFNDICDNDLGITEDSKLPKVQSMLNDMENRGFPILSMSWSIGLCFWTLLVFAYITKKRYNFKYLYPYVPVLGIWITMMLASPVSGEFRYVYGAFCSLPLLILYPFILKNKKAKQ